MFTGSGETDIMEDIWGKLPGIRSQNIRIMRGALASVGTSLLRFCIIHEDSNNMGDMAAASGAPSPAEFAA